MSWSIEEHIGEFRPFPAQVVVYRGETDECMGYVRGDVADRLKAENAKLRELAADMLKAMRHVEESAGMDVMVGYSPWFAPKLRELGIEVEQ